MNDKIKLIIRESMARIKSGKGTGQDHAIRVLLEHNKRFRQRIKDLEEELETGGDKIPAHQQTPWYMK